MFQHNMDDDTSLHRRLQDGIYYRKDESPGRSYRLVLLNVTAPTSARARAAIGEVWTLLQELRDGLVRDLRPSDGGGGDRASDRYDGNLTCLLAFGARLFDPGRNLTPHGAKPDRLMRLSQSEGPFSRLKWVAKEGQPDEADLALQLIGDTELAVSRPVVEIYRLITKGMLPLELRAFYGGFNRPDKRSWLNFHDGISNIPLDQRAAAIEVRVKNPPADPEWMVGGTYMACLRLAIQLDKWWDLPRNLQEIIVGRDKLTGCPLVGFDEDALAPRPMPGCPVKGKPLVEPSTTTSIIRQAHMHRANAREQGRGDVSVRIFRQGYEFLEPSVGSVRPGLNFVSFQCDIAKLQHILTEPRWMKTVNFGGPDDHPNIPSLEIARVLSGGYYAVPPKSAAGPFPGAEIFDST